MILTFIFIILIITIIILFFLESYNLIRFLSINSAGLVFLLSSFLLITYNTNNYYFQNVIMYDIGLNFLSFFFIVGLDSISLFFFLLSSFLIFVCILFIWDEPDFKAYAINLFIINLLLLLIFSVLDIMLFYMFFEALLIPMFIIIGIWGSRERKIRAAFLFFFYTLIGSLFMLLAILYIYDELGLTNFEYIIHHSFTELEQSILWIAFFLSFAAKVPIFPFHLWLPEAHVEAPTIGSVLLAGILLKLGIYGFLRFSLTLFPIASLYFSPIVYLFCIFGIILASFTAIRQTDLKRIIAYSSIAHMNLVTLGIFSFNLIGIEGSILQSISHGFVASGLFLLVGILYSRYHSRNIYYYSGLVHVMPLYSIFFLFFTLANIALPGTSSFIGEFLLLNSIFKVNFICCFLASLGVILCGSYSLWLYNRIIFGNLKVYSTKLFKELTFREFIIILPLFFLVIIFGIYPKFILEYLHMSSITLLWISTAY